MWLAAATTAGLVVQNELNEALDSALAETAQRILPLAVVEIINREDATYPQYIAALREHDEHLTYLVRDAAGTILLHSHNAEPAVFPARPVVGYSTTATHRLYGEAAVRNTFFVEVAQPLAHRRKAAIDAAVSLLYPLLVLVPLTLLGIWLFVHFSLRRVIDYSQAVEARGAGDLSPVATNSLPTEILPVAESVNHLLERLRRALEAQRSFTANSAHELRTPLAEMLAQIQRLRRETTAPTQHDRQALQDRPAQQDRQPRQDRLAKMEASLRKLLHLSERLMQLARAEGGRLLAEKPQDIVVVLRCVVEDFRRQTSAPLILDVPESGAYLSLIDPDALAILLRNLIENALRHGDPDQPVAISLSAPGVLRVVNGGAVVPPELLNRLTQRFVRTTTRTTGSGLGLAIVAAIAEGAGAALQLLSPASGSDVGFEVRVHFSGL